jgi:hypothetical protein
VSLIWANLNNAIRGEWPEAKIIALTTYADDVLAQRALKAGGSDLRAEEPHTRRDLEYDS